MNGYRTPRQPPAVASLRGRPGPARSGAHRRQVDAGTAGERRAAGSRGGFVLLLAVIAILNLMGLAMVLSASSVQSLSQYGTPWYYFERQVMWLAVGVVAFFLALRTEYHRWRRFAAPAMVLSLVLLLAVLAPGVGIHVGGSSRWLGRGSFRFQPSEFAKLATVFFAADVLDRRGERIHHWRYATAPVLIALGLLAVLIMAQPDMGTTMVIACIVLASLYTAAAPLRPLFGLLGVGGLATLGLAVAAPYRWQRLTSFLHPFKNASSTGYQSAQGLIAIGSGRLLGVGLGASPASWGYLPNQQTDFIFAIVAAETGLLGSLLLIGLFVSFAVLGVRAACRAPDRFGALLAGSITAWIIGQAVINIGAVVGLLPVTGVPLPFVSFGGSSLVFSMFAVGVLCNVSKRSVSSVGASAPPVEATEAVSNLERLAVAPLPPRRGAARHAAPRPAASRAGAGRDRSALAAVGTPVRDDGW